MQVAPQTLHEAAKVGDEDALKRLIDDGQDVNAKDRRGITALGVAVGFNRISCIRCLLDAGADVHMTDMRGSTVLHYAAGVPLNDSRTPACGMCICIDICTPVAWMYGIYRLLLLSCRNAAGWGAVRLACKGLLTPTTSGLVAAELFELHPSVLQD